MLEGMKNIAYEIRGSPFFAFRSAHLPFNASKKSSVLDPQVVVGRFAHRGCRPWCVVGTLAHIRASDSASSCARQQ